MKGIIKMIEKVTNESSDIVKGRDEFTSATRKALAERVAWRCSCPGCGQLTVGPSHENEKKTTNVGEAAHITAASKGGPRYDPNLTSEDRKSISNGIWMCRHHARLIDSDDKNYSPETIRQWKIIAENNIYQELKDCTNKIDLPYTLVQIGKDHIFRGIWKKVENKKWTFIVKDFVYGDLNSLKDFCFKINNKKVIDFDKFIVIESQGDGRVIGNFAEWELNNDKEFEFSFITNERIERLHTNEIGTDLKLSDSGDLVIENGDLATVEGVDTAIQKILICLSTVKGEDIFNREAGSVFLKYYWDFKDNIELLGSLLKLELSRLSTVPVSLEHFKQTKGVQLNFINRILSARVISNQKENNRIPIEIKFEFSDGNLWSGKLNILIPDKEETSRIANLGLDETFTQKVTGR